MNSGSHQVTGTRTRLASSSGPIIRLAPRAERAAVWSGSVLRNHRSQRVGGEVNASALPSSPRPGMCRPLYRGGQNASRDRAMEFDRFPLDRGEGTVLAHSLKAGDVVFRKGHRLAAEDLDAPARGRRRNRGGGPARRATTWRGRGGGGAGRAGRRRRESSVAPAFTGRANLMPRARGVLVVDAKRVDRLNRIDEAVTLATLPGLCRGRARPDGGDGQDHPVRRSRRSCWSAAAPRWREVRWCGWRPSGPGAPA